MASHLRRTDDTFRVKAREFVLQETPGVFPTQGAVAFFVNTTGLLYPSSAIIDPSGTLHVLGLDVSGDTTLNNTTVLGTLDVSGTATFNVVRINKTLDVSGTATFNVVRINKTLDVSGDATFNVVRINKTLDVSGDATFNMVRINKTLDVSGATTLRGTLDVSGDATFNVVRINKTLDVYGATTLHNTLDVSGATSLHDILSVDGKTILNSTLYVSDDTSLNNTTVRGTLDVCGNVTVDGTLDVSGDVRFNVVRVNKTLDVFGATTLHDTLDVSGTTSLHDILSVDGKTILNSTLSVSDDTSLNNAVVHGNLDVCGNVTVDGTLDVSGYDVYKELSYLNNHAAIVGSITMFGGSVAPTGWLLCQGGSYAAALYPELFAVIGTTFGSAGAGLFNVPDLTQRFPYGKGSVGPAIGTTGGSATITDVPAHSHTLVDLSGGGHAKVVSIDSGHEHRIGTYESGTGTAGVVGNSNSSTIPYTWSTDAGNANITSTVSGATESTGVASVSILPPYITLNYIICYTGATAAH